MNTESEILSDDLETLTHFISHDLKSPIRSVVGFSNLLLENQSQNLNESSISNIKRIINTAQRMQLLIDGMLTYVRLSQRTLNISELDISKICLGIVADKKAQYNDVSREILISSNLKLMGDEVLITVLLENLIDNAFRSTRTVDHGQITIDSVMSPKGLAFRVSDNGIGFNMEHSQYLFKPFELLHAEQKWNGIGMGLPIAKKIVDRHKGIIWFESQVNVGTTFFFQINPIK